MKSYTVHGVGITKKKMVRNAVEKILHSTNIEKKKRIRIIWQSFNKFVTSTPEGEWKIKKSITTKKKDLYMYNFKYLRISVHLIRAFNSNISPWTQNNQRKTYIKTCPLIIASYFLYFKHMYLFMIPYESFYFYF